MVFCVKCGTKCPDGARFCVSCGNPIVDPAASEAAPATPPRSAPAPVTTQRSSPATSPRGQPATSPRGQPATSPRGRPAASQSGVTMTACGPAKASDVLCPVCKKQCGGLLDKVVGTQHYHLDCFICNNCKKYLGESRFFRDPREENMLLCEACKNTICGAPGRHAAITHAGVSTDAETGSTGYTVHRPVMSAGGINMCRRCGKTVYENEKLRCCEAVWHRKCFTCEKCGCKLDLSRYETVHNNPYCRDCYMTIPH